MGLKIEAVLGRKIYQLICDDCFAEGPISISIDRLIKKKEKAHWKMWNNNGLWRVKCADCSRGMFRDETGTRICIQCGRAFYPSKPTVKRCSPECSQKSQRKAERPTKARLRELVWEMPTTDVAKMFGVSDKAVSKWCKKYEIEKPPRGYWAKQKADKKTKKRLAKRVVLLQ